MIQLLHLANLQVTCLVGPVSDSYIMTTTKHEQLIVAYDFGVCMLHAGLKYVLISDPTSDDGAIRIHLLCCKVVEAPTTSIRTFFPVQSHIIVARACGLRLGPV